MKRIFAILLLVVALLVPNFAVPGEADAATQFSDLKAKYSDWGDFAKLGVAYDTALNNCMAKGVVTGYPDDTIGGGRNLTRAEAAAMICRLKYEELRIEVPAADGEEEGSETVVNVPSASTDSGNSSGGDSGTQQGGSAASGSSKADATQADWLADQLALCTDSEMDDMNKALSIAEHICEYMNYSEKKGNDFGGYPKTLEIARTTADDKGYAMRYYLLCEEAGVECQIVTPPVGDHVWNRVKLEGVWYYVDVAMMDAGSGVDYNYSLIPSMLPNHDVYGDESDYKFDIIYSL